MNINDLITKTDHLNWQEKILFVEKNFSKIIFSTSFSLEDQVITDFIAKQKLSIKFFTIDTFRLFDETYQTWQKTIDDYMIKIASYSPKTNILKKFVEKNGVNAFYQSVDLRKQCCEIRKVEPLKRALKGYQLWISGIRQEQSSIRLNKNFFEFDDNLKIIKFYPLLKLTEAQLWSYIEENSVIHNKLHNLGFRSIGCSPCTRAISKNDDIRSGRWWWENNQQKECGLHKS
ncbi:MAG: phosphoadenylyl-sulfate reductase [Alphaproteobacteria bacterium]